MRPTEDMWERSKEPFERICNELKPQQMLVLGVTTWSHVARYFSAQKLDGDAELLRVSGRAIRSDYIAHPSSFGFRYADWGPRARALLS